MYSYTSLCWTNICSNGQKLRSSSSLVRKERKVSHNNRHRLLEVDLHGDYWNSPLMTFENAFVARHAYFLALTLQQRYNLDEIPRIRWLASYKIWGLSFLVFTVLYIIWKLAVILAHLLGF